MLSNHCEADDVSHSRKIPLLFRVRVPVDAGNLEGLKVGPSVAFPGVLAVVGVTDKALSKVEEGDRVTHVNGVEMGQDMEDIRRALANAKDTVEVQFMKKRNPYVKRPYHSQSGRAHIDDNAVARCEPSVAAEEEIHGKDLHLFAYFLYEVKMDDVLNDIAHSFGIKVDDIREDNRDKFEMGCPGHIYPGEILRIRNKDFVRMEAHGPWSPVLSAPCDACVLNHTSRVRGLHDVQAKDTLESIAALYEMTVADLRNYNRQHFPCGEPSHLEAGMSLLVFRPHHELMGKSSPKNSQFKPWAPECA